MAAGRSIRCPFPGHDDNNPSFSFIPATNSCFCHGCGRGGDVVDLVALQRSCSKSEALRWIRDQFCSNQLISGRVDRSAYAPRPTTALPSAVSDPSSSTTRGAAADDWEVYSFLLRASPLQPSGAVYLRSRGLSPGTHAHFQIGQIGSAETVTRTLLQNYSAVRLRAAGVVSANGSLAFPNQSLLIPFLTNGTVTYLQSRALPGSSPRWMAPAGITKEVFNVEALKRRGDVYLCEGVTDVLAAHELGLVAIGLLGSMAGLPVDIMARLRNRTVYLMPDMDRAGERMAERLARQLEAGRVSWSRKRLPFGNDLSEFLTMKRKAQ